MVDLYEEIVERSLSCEWHYFELDFVDEPLTEHCRA